MRFLPSCFVNMCLYDGVRVYENTTNVLRFVLDILFSLPLRFNLPHRRANHSAPPWKSSDRQVLPVGLKEPSRLPMFVCMTLAVAMATKLL